jgi:hypothetical protein
MKLSTIVAGYIGKKAVNISDKWAAGDFFRRGIYCSSLVSAMGCPDHTANN